ncbi:nuclear transport factor 2 family protein [Nocardia sp. NPDC088792]|uniref:nuclear transport factor 2 family protein n=1 Tax=Nocardia sp. NPDC088792 TaxID=3364332 RepID=UPI003829959E
MRTAHGHAGFRHIFEPLFLAVPDLRAEVRRWGATHDGVLIEFVARGTLGRRALAIPLVDRFVLEGGPVRRRDTFANPLAIARPVVPWALAHPRLALRLLTRLITRSPRSA